MEDTSLGSNVIGQFVIRRTKIGRTAELDIYIVKQKLNSMV
jgi:hypothetical protein